MRAMTEHIVRLRVNGEEMPSFLCSPEALDELAVGFLLTQGRIESIAAVKYVTVTDDVADVTLYGELLPALALEKRVAGLEKIDFPPFLMMADLKKAMDDLMDTVLPFGTHGILLRAGGTTILRADVGRHNAMDKVIGRASMDGIDLKTALVAATGRISFEMLMKVAGFKLPYIVSKKYPSDLSARVAQKLGFCIVGNATKDVPEVYSGAERILVQ